MQLQGCIMERCMDTVFRALADPTRRTIVEELAERTGQTLYEICVRLIQRHRLSITRQAVSKHFEVLERAGIVIVERRGRYKLHYLSRVPLVQATEWIERCTPTANGDETPP